MNIKLNEILLTTMIYLICLCVSCYSKAPQVNFKEGDKVYIFSEKREFAYTNKKSCIEAIITTKKGKVGYLVNLYCEGNTYIFCWQDEIFYE